MVRRKKRIGRVLLGIIVLLLVVIGAALWFVYPTQSLDMRYRSVDFKDKLMTMVTNRDTLLYQSVHMVGHTSGSSQRPVHLGHVLILLRAACWG